mgnify:CR=1 FL=1
MRINLYLFLFLIPFIFFFILGPYSFVSTFDTFENYIPIYKYLFNTNLNDINFFQGINSGESFLSYGWYPWLQILFFKNLNLSFSYQIILFIFILINIIGFYLLLNKDLFIKKEISLIFSILSLLIILRTASLDFGHIACTSILIHLCNQFTKTKNLKHKLIYVSVAFIIVSGLLHIQYIPLLFLYSFIFSFFLFKNFLNNILFHFIVFIISLALRSNEIFSILYSINVSSREIASESINILYLIYENIFPLIDLQFLKIRSFIYLILLLFVIIFFNKSNKHINKLFYVFSSIFLILIINKYFIDFIPLMSKFRLYPIVNFLPHIFFVSIASLFNSSLKPINNTNMFIKIFVILSFIQSSLFMSNHLINWLYHGNFETIDNHPYLNKISKNFKNHFRIATYGYFTNFPLYYGLDSIGGYAPVSSYETRKFWNDVNKNALLKFSYLKKNYDKSFNNNSFVYVDNDNLNNYNFEDLFNLDILAMKNTKYLISKEKIKSNRLKLVYNPKINLDDLSLTNKLLKLLEYNFTFSDTFYIYEFDNYRDRVFVLDKDYQYIDNVKNKLYDFKYKDNKYFINFYEARPNIYLILNHYYNKMWYCIDINLDKPIKITKFKDYLIKLHVENSTKIVCSYKNK